jgi:pimeloyl-ACP methyl ester carboxylesterase
VSDLWTRTGGRPGPTLLLLHGLGATSDVWDGLTSQAERHWPGRWIAPDLPGHGRSAPLPRYTFGDLAAALAGLVDSQTTILGHSLGGVLALELAAGRHGPAPVAVVGVGIKIHWTIDELERAAALARRPVATFPTEDAAVERHLKVAGLTGLIPADDPRAAAGVRRDVEGWRLALDPAAFGVGAPDMPGLLAAARCPVRLAAGDGDHMVDPDRLRALDPDAAVLPGTGHNAHVENPAIVGRLLPAWQDSAEGLS